MHRDLRADADGPLAHAHHPVAGVPLGCGADADSVVGDDEPGTQCRLVARDGIDSLLFSAGNAEALAKTLNRVLTEPGLAGELRDEGTKRADAYSFDALAKLYVQRYERLLA